MTAELDSQGRRKREIGVDVIRSVAENAPVMPNEGRAADIEYALSNSLGFGGHNACVLLKKWNG